MVELVSIGVLSTVPKYRKSISKSQLKLLLVIFKFRFVSSEYVGKYVRKDKSTVYERLFVLVQQGYVRKDYDRSYRLQLRPAVYSLTTKGIKYLRDSDIKLSELALRNMYKNSSASLQLVDHSLNVFKLCLLLISQYSDTFDMFTRSELSSCYRLVRPLPDLYLRRASKRSTKSSYQLEVIEAGTYTWIIRKRLQAHQDFCEDSDAWNSNYPTLLFVCGNTNTEKRIQRLVLNSYLDFEVYTTTEERFNTDNTKVWLVDYDPDDDEEMELVGL
jgi:DNA-binding MarR family transcriptional regulator